MIEEQHHHCLTGSNVLLAL